MVVVVLLPVSQQLVVSLVIIPWWSMFIEHTYLHHTGTFDVSAATGTALLLSTLLLLVVVVEEVITTGGGGGAGGLGQMFRTTSGGQKQHFQ
jgi:hypothetical protein